MAPCLAPPLGSRHFRTWCTPPALRWLWDAAGRGGRVAFSQRPPFTSPYDTLGAFSSFGPTADGRVKV